MSNIVRFEICIAGNLDININHSEYAIHCTVPRKIMNLTYAIRIY